MADAESVRLHPPHDNSGRVADKTRYCNPGGQFSDKWFFENPGGYVQKGR
jgi:hypothetical protein